VKRLGLCLLLLVAALIAWDLQPWRFVYAGYARADVAVAGGTLRFELVDHAGERHRGHCLSYHFSTREPAGEAIAVVVDRIGTRSQPDMRKALQSSGTIEAASLPGFPHFFHAPNVGGLEFPFDEPLEVRGAVQYRGASHPFRAELQLKRWHRDLRVTSFCVG
jgi:hypothetical protein